MAVGGLAAERVLAVGDPVALAVALDPPHRPVPLLTFAGIARPLPQLPGDVVGWGDANGGEGGALALGDQVLDHCRLGAGLVADFGRLSSSLLELLGGVLIRLHPLGDALSLIP